METPLYGHVVREFSSVYEPSEDTFLLIDTLEKEIDFIRELKPLMVAEIGSGSGVVVTALSRVLKSSAFCVATDINLEACKATHQTALVNNTRVECVRMAFLRLFRCQFDVLVFNPPYVVTEPYELTGEGLQRAWAGGLSGRQVMDELFPLIPQLLTDRGVFYLVAIKENDPEEICNFFNKKKFSASIINQRKIRGEHLFVLKIYRHSDSIN